MRPEPAILGREGGPHEVLVDLRESDRRGRLIRGSKRGEAMPLAIAHLEEGGGRRRR